jgi:hypothetical protein
MTGRDERDAAGEREFWERVHDCLDRRCDPLDDAGVREWLLANPERLEEIANLREGLAALARSGGSIETGGRARRRRAWRGVAAVVAAALIVVVTILARARRDVPDVGHQPSEPPAAGRILEYRIMLVTEGRGERVETVIGPEDRTVTRSVRIEPRSDDLLAGGPTTITHRITRRQAR